MKNEKTKNRDLKMFEFEKNLNEKTQGDIKIYLKDKKSVFLWKIRKNKKTKCLGNKRKIRKVLKFVPSKHNNKKRGVKIQILVEKI